MGFSPATTLYSLGLSPVALRKTELNEDFEENPQSKPTSRIPSLGEAISSFRAASTLRSLTKAVKLFPRCRLSSSESWGPDRPTLAARFSMRKPGSLKSCLLHSPAEEVDPLLDVDAAQPTLALPYALGLGLVFAVERRVPADHQAMDHQGERRQHPQDVHRHRDPKELEDAQEKDLEEDAPVAPEKLLEISGQGPYRRDLVEGGGADRGERGEDEGIGRAEYFVPRDAGHPEQNSRDGGRERRGCHGGEPPPGPRAPQEGQDIGGSERREKDKEHEGADIVAARRMILHGPEAADEAHYPIVEEQGREREMRASLILGYRHEGSDVEKHQAIGADQRGGEKIHCR